MNICLFNVNLYGYGGSELWTYTMYNQLKQDHNVCVYTKYPGIISDKLNTVTEPPKDIDVIIGAHWQHMKDLWKLAPIILVSHSFFLRVERFAPGAAAYVAVSDEVARVESKYNPTVIYNPVNMQMYKPKKPLNKKLTNVFYLSHGGGKAVSIVKEACLRYGVKYMSITKGTVDLSTQINEADLCIGIGRCLIEAMACGRNVISGDWRGFMNGFEGAGFITPDNIDSLRPYNYSGRDKPQTMTVDKLIEYFEMYDNNISLVDSIRPHHEASVVAKQFMEVYGQIPR